MSNRFSEEWIENEKDSFAEDNLHLEYDSEEFIEKFKEHLIDNDPKNEPTLSAADRNPSLAR